MKTRKLLKNTFRDIWRNRSRFISILLIVVLGTGFYTGIKASSPDMIRSIDNYFEKYQLMDLHYSSSVGFSLENVLMIEQIEGVEAVEGKYHVDAILNLGTIDEMVARVHSYNATDKINKYELVKGRFPNSANEVAIEFNSNLQNYEIGSTIILHSEGLVDSEYEIVGIVRSPLYLNYERDKSAIGKGFVDFYVIALESNFKTADYNDVYIKLSTSKGISTYDNLYLEYLNLQQEKISKIVRDINQDAIVQHTKRTDIPGFISYREDSDKVDKIAAVFPIFFILLAILVTLSTMTRMVAEQRVEIGTLSSLGASKGYILSKYFIYALIATFIGSIIGVTIGMLLIPKIIYDAFAMSYILPNFSPYYRWDYFGVNIAVAVLSTELATVFACIAMLKDNPANLLRAKAPKAGKKTIIEKISIIWKRLGFNTKMTVRNLFRYKGRTLITIIGIAGCTGLMLTGFGLYNAVTKMGDKQFDEIFVYDGIAVLNPYISSEELSDVNDMVISTSEINDHLFAFQEEVDIKNENDIIKSNIIIPSDINKINNFINIKNRKTNQNLELNNKGVIISEKLAKLLSIEINEYIKVENTLGNSYSYQVIGITENYTNHFIYMTSKLYKDTMNDYHDNIIYLNFNENGFYEDFTKTPNVLSIIFSKDNKEVFSESAKNLTEVIIVIIVASALLAFVVLYNLSNINITERTKELSTFKVLGMTDTEVTLYIARENIFSTILGIGVGLLIGYYFVEYVIRIIEYNEIMFIREINAGSYISTTILTIIFASIVSIFSHMRLKRLDMVEAMKAIE